jgi:hypothetical protein
MVLIPVVGDVKTTAQPYFIVLLHIVEESGKGCHPAWSPN